MAQTTEGEVQIAGAGTSPEANQKLYDDWAQKYEEDVRTWGYTMPEDCAKILKKYCPEDRVKDFEVLDAGAGDGLSGKAITDLGFENVTGIDLSPELIKIAQENKIYKKAEVADLSKPLHYANGQFDAITVVGVMTYLEPDGCCLEEFCRVVKPGGLVIFTHRSDKVDKWTVAHEKFISDGKWEKVEITDPLPYLPQNPEYADKIKVIIHVFRVAHTRSMAHAGFVLESGLVPGKLDDVWAHIFPLTFKFWEAVDTTSKVEDDVSLLGQYIVAFKDNTVKTVRITEVSERLPNKRSLGFEFVASDPPLGYSSRMDQITLSQVTHTGGGKSMVYVEYSTDFSNDANMQAVQDSKYKKVEFLNDLAAFTAANCVQ